MHVLVCPGSARMRNHVVHDASRVAVFSFHTLVVPLSARPLPALASNMVRTPRAPKNVKLDPCCNFKKSSVDLDLLSDEMKSYVKAVGVKEAFEFREYNSLWSSCAVREGLGQML